MNSETDPQTLTAPRLSVLGLIRDLGNQGRTLLRQEVQLAKTEISESISSMGRNSVMIAAGGLVMLCGLLVLLIGLGWLLAWFFVVAGFHPIFAVFMGSVIIGLAILGIGSIFLVKGMKNFSRQPIVPKRTIETVENMVGAKTENEPKLKPEPGRKTSAAELQARVEQTEHRMEQEMQELTHRLSPSQINAEVKQRLRANPYGAGIAAILAGLISGLLLTRRSKHA